MAVSGEGQQANRLEHGTAPGSNRADEIAGNRQVLAPFLQAPPHVCILDGGLTTSLPNDVGKHFLWGHQLLYGFDGGLPALKQVHRSFLVNGADVIGTLTYKLSHEMLDRCKERGLLDSLSEEEGSLPAEALFARSVGAAVEARDEFWTEHLASPSSSTRQKPLIFASCGPFVDSTQLFRGATDPNTRSGGQDDTAEMRAYYERKLTALRDCAPDGIAVESLAGSREGLIAAEVLQSLEIPGWISFCCKDAEHTNSGERLADCANAILDQSRRFSSSEDHSKVNWVQALGVNCVHPDNAPSLIGTLRKAVDEFEPLSMKDRPAVVAYPNSGEKFDASAEHRCWYGGETMKYLTGDDAVAYHRAGANVIGGCCRVAPDQIGFFRNSIFASD
mmetsp:Transcript_56829/g.158269  ORF Transcript_56829/g.158269 Transcript_56829/m.158269 type:complete len:390 (+) Transcript_56829:53-1222(+)|eukprot:CAMPEP_0117468476 /NCGR_PEP_ID=MMETSP0784-20121206/6198_1 /TAXON_ID=39447 /ORGANISM="" /LENGTH=389 /DNA_ID=CAMNT_0005262491 /DNA_START=1 /DNA_END=1170 /DNA_ORIENTATION=-